MLSEAKHLRLVGRDSSAQKAHLRMTHARNNFLKIIKRRVRRKQSGMTKMYLSGGTSIQTDTQIPAR
jgi:hypothetical protein